MKKCKGCHREVDKYAIACQYCGRIPNESKNVKEDQNAQPVEREGKDE